MDYGNGLLGNDEAREELRKQEQIRRLQYTEDFRELLGSRLGRRFVYSILSRTGVFWSTYNPKAQDVAIDMAISEGRKQIGYELMNEITAICPANYHLMVQEHEEDERNRKPNT